MTSARIRIAWGALLAVIGLVGVLVFGEGFPATARPGGQDGDSPDDG